MYTDWLLALVSMTLSFTVVVVVTVLYTGLGRQETAIREGRERSKARSRESSERYYARHRGI